MAIKNDLTKKERHWIAFARFFNILDKHKFKEAPESQFPGHVKSYI